MCGYNIESSPEITAEDIESQFAKAIGSSGEVDMIKVYTSGSFLDGEEMPEEIAGKIAETCADMGARLLVESRPEYITTESLDRLLTFHDNLEVAIGLESANDAVLKHSINKGFSVSDYDRAAELLNSKDIDLRTYLLMKPPFLTEAEAMEDTVDSARHAARFSKVLSVNPVNVQRGTLVERLWREWSYRPPWLWSVLSVLRECARLDARVVCDPVGGGSVRGAHNCGECDATALDALKAFSRSQRPDDLAVPQCGCADLWRTIVKTEGVVLGGTCDLERFFRRS